MTHRIEETIERNMCIGCGACSAASGGAIAIKLDTRRLYQADITAADEQSRRAGSRVCPFSDESPNEDRLGVPQPDDRMDKDQLLGTYSRVFAGRVSDDEYLRGSSSGGLTSWLTQKLIEGGIIDAVLSVGQPGPTNQELVGYGVAGEDEAPDRRKSWYYAVTMADVLKITADSDLRYALVGIPCYIRAARSLCREVPRLADRLTIFVGLVCGHYKTQAFAESLAWQVGVPPELLAEVDFRVKRPDRSAADYDFGARATGEHEWRYAPTRDLVGGNWGHNAFQPEACNFCDDVVAECADISFGDAWLPQFSADPRGTNIVVCRNRRLEGLFEQAAANGEIQTFPLTAGEAVESQAGGFRHRREGLAVRLADDLAAGLSVPRKRVNPDIASVSRRRLRLLRHRRKMAALSHISFREACAQHDLSIYLDAMRREIQLYRRLEASIARRILRRVRRALSFTIRSIGTRRQSQPLAQGRRQAIYE